MQVTLDQDQWEVGSEMTLGEVLADVSERAHARSRIVTSLKVDQRKITDRDLDPTFLAEHAARFTRLTATSQSQNDIVQSAQPSIRRYAELVRSEGTALVAPFRFGRQNLSSFDTWLGKLADYLELVTTARNGAQSGGNDHPLTAWVQQLLQARAAGDMVLIADLLEYEILPRVDAE